MAYKLLDVFEQAIEGGRELQTPLSGEGFVSRGLIGPWTLAQSYVVAMKAPPPDHQTWDFTVEIPWMQYFFTDYTIAKEFYAYAVKADQLKRSYGPQQHFVFRIHPVDVLNLTDIDKWNDPITFAGVSTSFRAARFYETHLLMIPSMVHAFAKAQGLAVPDMDWEDLLDPAFLLTDELEEELIGSPDAKDPNDSHHWTQSVYGKQRAALWAALGEPDVMKYQTMSTITRRGKPSRAATTSEKLSSLLRMTAFSWEKPIYARVAQAASPAMKQKKARIPLVLNVYPNRATAEAAVASVSTEDNSETVESTTDATGGAAGYPTSWAADGMSQADWDAAVTDLIADGMSVTNVAKELGSCTANDVVKTKKRLEL